MKQLCGLRILICGKGGSGKSSVTTLVASALQKRGYDVVLLDGDASNPGGLVRLALGMPDGPQPLIEFFGGREKVICPVDDPSPLTRLSDAVPVVEAHLHLDEIPPAYYIRKGHLLLFQVGKIQQAFEGCDGPMSKISRDFILDGPYVTLIDVEAGIEHFGRGVERNVDVVLIVVDPTFESFGIAARVMLLSRLMGIRQTWAILNSTESEQMKSRMQQALEMRKVGLIGCIRHDPAIRSAGLEGSAIGDCRALEDAAGIVDRLEASLGSAPDS